MPPQAGAEGTHQHHPGHAGGLAGLDLLANPDGIHLQGAREVDARAGARGDHQGITAPQGLGEPAAIPQPQPHQLSTPQGLGDGGAGPHDCPHGMAALQGLLHHPPAGLAGGAGYRQKHGSEEGQELLF